MLKQMLKQIDTWLIKIIKSLLVVAMLIGSIIIFINVILRYFFESGIAGAYEMVRYLIVGVTFLGASLLIIDNEHLTMDALTNILPTTLKKIAEVFVCLIGFIFSFVLVYYSFNVMDTLSSGLTPELQIPAYIPFIPLTVGSTLAGIKFIQRAFIQFKSVEG